jgi:hypothetical protein
MGNRISDQFSNFHGQWVSIACLNLSGVSSLFSSGLFLGFVFFAFQNKLSTSFCFSGSISVILVLLFITKNKYIRIQISSHFISYLSH